MLNSQVEQFKPIAGFEELYRVSSFGRVLNSRGEMKTYLINSGYRCLKLTRNGVRTSYLLHRIVAGQFIPNTHGKPEVNHLDGNKLNCSASNLEWVTSAENRAHAKSTGIWVYNKPSTGLKLGKMSIYHNVTWDKCRGKWVGAVASNGTAHFRRRFDNEVDAARHVNWILDELGLTDRPRNDL